ncbi:LysM peptidoglycan-binding domain-containing protein [Clostridium sp. CS001]|uniref:LysM peptidoglycan-binding domain-containing protein n=1 Tax=Clostridium sp. CS001 TaxID=2880648 RepID=UPI001CF33E36|nr:LysM peptidoglycan-binding domain-containing protein [Clostridium sp. CS001]MCB2288559.1 LysM peptidoglycan-binding domain-containing protein [Clostridium sp. CS001]
MPYQNSHNQCPAGSVPYTIRDKDTLGNIASFYNTTVQDIVKFNPGISPNNLQVGEHLCVPLKLQMYPSCPTTNYYVVAKGDTLISIADSFNITAQQLLYSNYGIDLNDLYVDQVLCIPVAPPLTSVEVNIGKHNLVVYRSGKVLKTYKIGLENPNDLIPRGTFTVVNKQVDPGVELGSRWIGLSSPKLGIQGTNNPHFIENISQGHSIVLSNSDVSELFNLMPVMTTVLIL